MSFLNSVLKAFVGDKRKKDLKLLQPMVEKVRSFDQKMEQLDLDGLRAKTSEFKSLIEEANRPFNDKIAGLERHP